MGGLDSPPCHQHNLMQKTRCATCLAAGTEQDRRAAGEQQCDGCQHISGEWPRPALPRRLAQPRARPWSRSGPARGAAAPAVGRGAPRRGRVPGPRGAAPRGPRREGRDDAPGAAGDGRAPRTRPRARTRGSLGRWTHGAQTKTRVGPESSPNSIGSDSNSTPMRL